MSTTKDWITRLKEWEKQRKTVVRMRKTMKVQEIADELEISVTRVYQILAKERNK